MLVRPQIDAYCGGPQLVGELPYPRVQWLVPQPCLAAATLREGTYSRTWEGRLGGCITVIRTGCDNYKSADLDLRPGSESYHFPKVTILGKLRLIFVSRGFSFRGGS